MGGEAPGGDPHHPQPGAGHDTDGVALAVDGSGDFGQWNLSQYDTPTLWTIPNDNYPDGWNSTLWGNGPHVVSATIDTHDTTSFEAFEVTSPGTLVTVSNGPASIAVNGVTDSQQVSGTVPLSPTISGAIDNDPS